MEIYLQQINKLRQLSGNAQIEYLEEIKSPVMEEILEFTYDPQLVYKIDKGKFQKVKLNQGLVKPKKKEDFTLEDWSQFTIYLSRLSNKRSATDDDVRVIKKFILSFKDEDVQSFLAMVLYKDLRLNMGIKKFQQVWPNFCYEAQLQLAENDDGRQFKNGLYSRKFDGKRMYIREGIAYSRQNKKCSENPIMHILNEIKAVPDYQDLVFDGELLYFDPDGKEDFQKAISLSSSDMASVECFNLYYVIFDVIAKKDFDKQHCEISTETAYRAVCSIFHAVESRKGPSVLATQLDHILIAQQFKEPEVLQYHRAKYKWEGLMYRDGRMPYQFKRTKSLLKIKDMQDGEFTLLDLIAGTGRNENRLGAISIKYKDTEVKVGSGYTDTDRDIIWNNAKIFQSDWFCENFNVKVQYFEETKDANGIPSLRFPVFLCFRDKNTLEEFTPEQIISVHREDNNNEK